MAAQKTVSITDKIQDIKVDTLWPKTQAWLFEHILNMQSLYQLIMIGAALAASGILYRLVREKMKAAIASLHWTSRNKRIADSMSRLLFPFIALTTIFIMTQIAASDLVGMDVWIINHTIKILMAWIVIRCMVQFIDSAPVRNTMATMIWIIAGLSIFGLLDKTTKFLEEIGFDLGDKNRISVLAICKGIGLLFVLVYAAQTTASLIDQRLSKSRDLTPSSRVLIGKIIRIGLIVSALFVGLTSSGIDLSLFAFFGGAIGLGVGFGLQKSLANLFSGMMLLVDKSIRPGDIIELENGTYGLVHQMAARYTEVVTTDKRSYLIPNEELITQRVINWSHNDTMILVSVNFGVHYNSNPHLVIDVAKKAVQKLRRVVYKHDISCNIVQFADSAINFRLNFWIDDPQNGIGNIKGEAYLALWDAFQENNIQIPYPHREVYVHKMDDNPDDDSFIKAAAG